ncbi:MAG: DUF2095 family protein [Archaeoglobi archaeon]|nr:DUF2095 family protein [Candidatus Mnemosynella sp.]
MKMSFKKLFPNLYKELERYDSIYPTVLDHLQICENEKEAFEVIEYFERIEEITPDAAEFLKELIKRFGVGVFGRRKRGEWEKYGLR